MSVIRPKPPEDPIHYDPTAVFAAGGPSRSSLDRLVPRLEQARRHLLAGPGVRDAVGPNDTVRDAPAFTELPDRLLADYGTRRPESDLFAVLTVARRIRETVDRVVVIGAGCPALAARAVFEACCHPFHNELSRGERGGRPRLSFAGFTTDNDSTQGLLDLLAPPGSVRGAADLLQRWGVVVVDATGDHRETALATRLFLASLSETVHGDPRRLAELVVPVTCRTGRLAAVARAIGCVDAFTIPDGIDGRSAAFTAAVLLPAAIVGIDVVRLLEGAAAMNRRFREAPVADNPVLQAAAVARLAEPADGAAVRVLLAWSDRLEAFGLWYGRLVAESFAAAGPGVVPFTAVAGRDGAPRGLQPRDAGGGGIVTELLVGEPRRDRLTLPAVAEIAADEDGLEGLVGRSWPDLLASTVAGRSGSATAGRGQAAGILLPRVDEHTVGQLLQMLMLATAVEGRLAADEASGQASVRDE